MSLDEYRRVAGGEAIDDLLAAAEHVGPMHLQHVNSTLSGGGVAEILSRMIPLLALLDIKSSWHAISGDPEFFKVTKAFHNALQGSRDPAPATMFETYQTTTATNLREFVAEGDFVLVHDPQPMGLIQGRNGDKRPWVWRCHIDMSAPHRDVWTFLRQYLQKYDAAVFSLQKFTQALPQPQFVVAPSIDPLSDKNRELTTSEIDALVNPLGLDRSRPIVTQVSRFDRFKDPVGVIAAYRLARARVDCQLVLAGGGATDDPEGEEVLREVQSAAGDDPDIYILPLPPGSDLLINALVRASTLVVQKSLKEGFGLTVSEALWKRKPVIGGRVGGICLQVVDGVTGFLVDSIAEAADRIVRVLGNPRLRDTMGEQGHEHVRRHFLLTRQTCDYLRMIAALGTH